MEGITEEHPYKIELVKAKYPRKLKKKLKKEHSYSPKNLRITWVETCNVKEQDFYIEMDETDIEVYNEIKHRDSKEI